MAPLAASAAPASARILATAQIRAVEAACFERVDSYAVMEAAGMEVAALAADMAGSLLLLAGSGNNGGDAVVAARVLAGQGRQVKVCMPLGKPADGTDAARALAVLEAQHPGLVATDVPALAGFDGIVDGLFGIGLSRDLDGAAARLVREVNASGRPILAIDVPSGIDPDTGEHRGEAVYATTTVTFFAAKPGLLAGVGKSHAGQVIVRDLGHADLIGDQGGMLLDRPGDVSSLRRHEAAHKGSAGTLAVVGGAPGMLGALTLASRAAVALGAGKVYAMSLDPAAPALDPLLPEVMWRKQLPAGATALVCGCGSGIAPPAKVALRQALASAVPLVLDADALNLIAIDTGLQQALTAHASARVLTPHAAEAARLLGTTTAAVLDDRVGAACQLAQRHASIVILKGSGTVMSDPAGQWGMVAAGNPGLAQAGSGDVLAGMVGALLAQGCPAWDAAVTGAWLHGTAADRVRDARGGMPLNLPLARVVDEAAMLLGRLLRPC